MTPSPSDPRARAIAMRQARLARISGIRRRVVASALALFVATWLLITVLLISGHDPALARTGTVSAAAPLTSTTTGATPATTTPSVTTRTSGTSLPASTPSTASPGTTGTSSSATASSNAANSSASSSAPSALTSSES